MVAYLLQGLVPSHWLPQAAAPAAMPPGSQAPPAAAGPCWSGCASGRWLATATSWLGRAGHQQVLCA